MRPAEAGPGPGLRPVLPVGGANDGEVQTQNPAPNVARDGARDGEFVTGVKTTGIYCRPSCPARLPYYRNVVFFPLPEVAEQAGFRPTCGDFFSPVTIRTPCGGGIRGGQTHSQSPEGIFTHVSGIKTVMPSNPYDAKGLLISAIESDDPVIFFEPKRIYNGPFDGDPDKPAVSWASHPKGEVPEGHYTVPIGEADIVQEGSELTIVTYGTLVHVATAAAEATDVDAEIVDVRSMSPLDVTTITDSVKKTGRCLIAHEATRFGGYGAELSATIQKDCFYHLEAPISRVAGWDMPYPHAFEWQYFPGKKRIAAGIRRVMEAAA